jgi:tRNA nucleotidyltransferase (CCA-adding enzyme)
VPERVWQETRRALEEPMPGAFVRVLHESEGLAVVFPELERLYGTEQRAEFHPEVDAGIHQELVSDMAGTLAPGDALVGWCALMHDLGKGTTPREELPRHVGHEHRGVALVQGVNARLKVPSEHAQMAELVCRYHLDCHRALELKPGTLLELLERIDAFRRPERVRVLCLACEADKRGRKGMDEPSIPRRAASRPRSRRAAGSAAPFVAQGLEGDAIGRGAGARRAASRRSRRSSGASRCRRALTRIVAGRLAPRLCAHCGRSPPSPWPRC